ncbi:MAG: MBL fold metallo-hydrolase [Candidatus Magasanikbacteria bacterium]|nr:MBL fold metallo-hydrolase [Candidatus Magasanikbacteria bacterium]
MKVHFFGAAGEVTGSNSLIETGNKKIIVDCGMFQGGDFNEAKNHDPLPYNASEISAVLVTHAHLDHVGRLPLLVKEGFTGFFYATPATMELAELVLKDALSVMNHDNIKFGRQVLYSEQDIAGVMQQFKPVDYYQWQDLFGDGSVKIYLRDAGHIFGSAFIEIDAEGKRLVFSGDVGNVHVPILRDTDNLPDDIDLLVCESTYGDKFHESDQTRREILEKAVLEAVKRGGVLMIPSFSLERTQELLYELDKLIEQEHRLPAMPIFLDSPLAIGATRIYRKYTQYYDESAVKLIKSGDDMFDFPGLVLSETKDDSKRINNTHNPKIIIAGAGMMNGGRILYHALRYLSDPQSTLLMIGYQAHGTLGREIQEGASSVRVMNEKVAVRCSVKTIGAFSAHGDQHKLLDWMRSAKNLPKIICLNHGENDVRERFKEKIKQILGTDTTIAEKNLVIEI